MSRRLTSRGSHVVLVSGLLAATALGCSGKDEPARASAEGGAAGEGQGTVMATGGRATGGSAGTGGSTRAGTGGTTSTGGVTSSGGMAGSAVTGGFANAAGAGLVPQITDGQAFCGSELCACNNAEDDDGDGQIDGFDMECIGAYDDDEGAFATGIPGDNSDPKWQDCFYDGNSGAGDDDCRYSTGCLTGELEPTDPDCVVTDACIEFCGARTPNGCDCFGCCGVFDDQGVEHFVYITGDCTEETLNDPGACIECTQSTQCSNECGECELCPGVEPEDLPASCWGAGGSPGFTCDDGSPICTPEAPCPEGFYCLNGCCYVMAL